MRHADEVKNMADCLRHKYVETHYSAFLQSVEEAIEKDINETYPKGFVAVPFGTRELVDSRFENRTHNVVLYLEELGYEVRFGAENPKDRTVDLIIWWVSK